PFGNELGKLFATAAVSDPKVSVSTLVPEYEMTVTGAVPAVGGSARERMLQMLAPWWSSTTLVPPRIGTVASSPMLPPPCGDIVSDAPASSGPRATMRVTYPARGSSGKLNTAGPPIVGKSTRYAGEPVASAENGVLSTTCCGRSSYLLKNSSSCAALPFPDQPRTLSP